MAKGKAKRSAARGVPSRAKRDGARGPRIEDLIARHRIEVIEGVLHRLQGVEPETFDTLNRWRNRVTRHRRRVDRSELDAPARQPGSIERTALAHLLRSRRQCAAEIREAIEPELSLIAALEDQCLPNQGFVGELTVRFGMTDVPPPPKPLQAHHRPRHGGSWQSSVFRCAARCRLAGAECVEPAVIACIKILRTLRDLVDDDGAPTSDEAVVFDDSGQLRQPARLFLETVDQPMRCTLDQIAAKAGRKEEYFRHVTGALRNLGLARLRAGAWSCTHEGKQLLRT